MQEDIMRRPCQLSYDYTDQAVMPQAQEQPWVTYASCVQEGKNRGGKEEGRQGKGNVVLRSKWRGQEEEDKLEGYIRKHKQERQTMQERGSRVGRVKDKMEAEEKPLSWQEVLR